MKIFRLKNGDMILGDPIEENEFTTIENPLHIVIKDGGYTFVNILKPITSDTKIKIQTSEILFTLNPNEKLVSCHCTTFSPIKTPKAKKLIV